MKARVRMQRADEKIKKDIEDCIFWDSRIQGSEDIEVNVAGGNVTLQGTVPSYLSQEAAYEDSWTVAGVSSVTSELNVSAPEEGDMRPDGEIADAVENLLLWNSTIDHTDIEASVSSGIVTLTGSVDAVWKKKYAERICRDIRGVCGVIDKLSVVPLESIFDQIIGEDIVNALSRHAGIAGSINALDVKVIDAKVILSGVVPDWNAYRIALEAAEKTRGVVGVENRLQITAPPLE